MGKYARAARTTDGRRMLILESAPYAMTLDEVAEFIEDLRVTAQYAAISPLQPEDSQPPREDIDVDRVIQ